MFTRILQLIFSVSTPNAPPPTVATPPVFLQVGSLGPLLAGVYRSPHPENADLVRWALMDVQGEAQRTVSPEAATLVHAIDDFEMAVDEMLACAGEQYDESDRFWFKATLEQVSTEALDVAFALQSYLSRHPRSPFY
ncbi:hypothetical protein [Microtetraspora glauca]|uniref:Uncharacterized protein n=1 Tax=Microtetraspora glauca TaxID=1996 RepID=A0ABV3GTK9_MICGL